MAGINKVILVGHLGKDPEVRYLEGGSAVANFTLATSESYKDKSGKRVEQTEWHNIVVWRGLAEIAEKYLKKGMQIYLEGKIRSRSWDDKDGNKRYSIDIVGDTFTILGKKDDRSSAEGDKASTDARQENNISNSSNPSTDDLPF